MRLVSVLFQEPELRQRGGYGRLARALVNSAVANSPATPLDLLRIDLELDRLGKLWTRGHDPERDSLLANTRKLEAWASVVGAADDGAVIGLFDCDLLILGDLSEVELLDFDVAYTARPPSAPYPINGGVVFVRVSEGVREFMEAWRAGNEALLRHPAAHEPLRQRYGGMNQAALGPLLERTELHLLALPCRIWNCEDWTWPEFSERTKVLHVKSALRQAVFGQRRLDATLSPLVAEWRKHDR
jgi:hypothetical protein